MRAHRDVELGLELGGDSASRFVDNAGKQQRRRMGEYLLVEAVLWQAMREYQKLSACHTRRELRQLDELDRWFLENDQRWGFSFVNLCEILDIEPAYVRAALKTWRDRQPPAVPPSVPAERGVKIPRGRRRYNEHSRRCVEL